MSRYALIAEPDSQRAARYLSLLDELHLEGVLARDGLQARNVLRQRGPPALLVTELALAGVDGFALLSELRALPTPPPALVATVFDELRLLASSHQARLGIGDFLDPRASRETLLERFRHALEGHPAHEPRAPEPPAPAPAPALVPTASAALPDVVAAVAQAFGVPVALLTLQEGARARSVAHLALARRPAQEPLDWTAFHLLAQDPEGVVVPDAARHALLAEEPLVREGLVSSYVGAPLRSASGRLLGTLCILDSRRRALGLEELGVLTGLARRIAGEMESRAHTHATPQEAAQPREVSPGTEGLDALGPVREALLAVNAGVLLVDGEGRGLVANAVLAKLLGLPLRPLDLMSLAQVRHHLAELSADASALLRRLEPSSGLAVMFAATLELERPRPRVVRWVARPLALPGGGKGLLSTFIEVASPTGAKPG